MGPKLKKPPRNSYSFFLDDYVEEQAERGRRISKKLAAEECAILWKRLSEEEKQPYVERAKADKEKEKHNKDNKFTSLGISYTEKDKMELKEKLAAQLQADEINNTIDTLLPGSTLKTHLFYLVHVNYYCKTQQGVFIPAELAISEFNLQEGVTNTFHALIDPGRIPTGFLYEAKKKSEEIHSLPIPPYAEGESDYLKILEDVQEIMKPGKMPNGKLPPLYTIDNNLKAAQSVMNWLTEADYPKDYELFRVYPIEKLLFKLKNRSVGREHEKEMGFPTISVAIAEIEKDFFAYTTGISCSFHKNDDDKYQNCSLSYVQRLVYMICDHCCQYLGIDLIPGRHSQLNCDSTRNSTRGSVSVASGFSSASSTVSKSTCGDNNSEFGVAASSYASSVKARLPSSSASVASMASISSKKSMEPLRLPKTKSRAFQPVASDMSDMESVVSAGDSIANTEDFEEASAFPNGKVKKEIVDSDDDDDDELPMYCIGRGSRKKRSVPEVGKTSLSHEDKKVPRGRGRPIYNNDDSD